MRLFLFKLAFKSAHKSMRLGKAFPTSNLPECYSIESYKSQEVKALNRNHIVVGKNEFILWHQEGDRQTYWESTATNDIDEFIRLFHKDKIYGQFATYSLILTQMLHGQYMEFAKNGKVDEFEKKKQDVQNKISFFLNSYLSSFKHKLLKQLIKIAN